MTYAILTDARTARDTLNRKRQSTATWHQPRSGRYYVTYETDGTYSIRFTYAKRPQVMEVS